MGEGFRDNVFALQLCMLWCGRRVRNSRRRRARMKIEKLSDRQRDLMVIH